MDFPGYKENVMDFRLLSDMPGLEWKLLRYKCRDLKLEGIYQRLGQLLSIALVPQVIIVVELLMLIHVILLFSLVKDINLITVLPYLAVMLLTPLFLLASRDPNNEHYHRSAILGSWLVAFFLITTDLIPALYLNSALKPNFDHVAIVLVYLMLPIGCLGNERVHILGLVVSLVYIVYAVWMLLKISEHKLGELVGYVMYILFLNLMCVSFLGFREYNLRRSVLTRYQSLYLNMVYEVAMKKEKALLHSIMPLMLARTLQDAITTHIEEDPNNLVPFSKTRLLFMEPHPEVSILEADIVNFTRLTTTMAVPELVTTLHELFSSFDLAANRNRATRIKLQGDSYTCVTGIPSYFGAHANACVNMALDMIELSRKVSQRRGHKIEVRVGVHSGEIMAGIIGHTKWQFDVWSKDVDIAYRLEASGLPGMVHVSSTTLNLLDNYYEYENGTETAKVDPVLQLNNLETYLIKSRLPDYVESEEFEDDDFSLKDYRLYFGNDYEDIVRKAQREMVNEVEHIPVNRVQSCKFRTKRQNKEKDLDEEYQFNVNTYYLFTIFRSWEMEWSFGKRPDQMMKYSLVMVAYAGFTFLCVNMIQGIDAVYYPTLIMFFSIILFVLFLAAFKKLWLGRRLTPPTQPSSFLTRWLIKASNLIEQSVYLRVPLAMTMLFILYVMSSQEVFSCDIAKLEVEIIDSELHDLEPRMFCFFPWEITYSVVMVLSLILIIIGVPLLIKLCVGLTILGLHLVTVHEYYGFAFERSETTFVGLESSLAHTWYVVAFWILVTVREGYLNYLLKVSYFMRVCFEKRVHETMIKSRSIKIIMTNILPNHVAEVFKEPRRSDELYYENFSQVAVMFATIENYESDMSGLRVLHEIICTFDDLLVDYQSRNQIEKIKVMGWTYIVACGLEVDHNIDPAIIIPVSSDRESENSQKSSSVRSLPIDEEEFNGAAEKDEDILVMTQFALDLLRIMREIRSKNVLFGANSRVTGSLKIVGLSKPHYDIWGHTVNMASRMSSTGVLDAIHVTKSTSKILRTFNIRCNYRGQTYVKGVGEVPTYLVALDQKLQFQEHYKINDSSKDSLISVELIDEKERKTPKKKKEKFEG
ncbi:adenylyl cyclase X E isoform X2 [Drosophila ficusphila]|uniref:adenylyl cyclase X E isoform X2 n=1 Tax=Drosophila ficusphila TaxID=30025 RepID=UPI001C8A1B5C|nr:adenylyl cyclase X E isoform X2 [Drosophila ficusphila]